MNITNKTSVSVAITALALFAFSFITEKNTCNIKTINNKKQLTTTGGSVIKSDLSATVSADAMNVVYLGLENPVTIVAPGIYPKELIISASDGITIRPTEILGKYVLTGSDTGNAKIYVKAKKGEEIIDFGSYDFRVKRVPNPIIMIDNYESNSKLPSNYSPKSLFAKSPEGFEFNKLNEYRISKWELVILNKTAPEVYSGNGPILDWVSSKIQKADSGAKIIFDVTIFAPDKSARKQSIIYTAN